MDMSMMMEDTKACDEGEAVHRQGATPRVTPRVTPVLKCAKHLSDIPLAPLQEQGSFHEPWSPSATWTSCSFLTRQTLSGASELQRTSSYGVKVASDMWEKIHSMEAQNASDRNVRRRMWMVELVVVFITIFFCIRVGSPKVLCPALDGAETGASRSMFVFNNAMWQMTVCGSWGGIMSPVDEGPNDLLDVANLQAARTRSLHMALDNLVIRHNSK